MDCRKKKSGEPSKAEIMDAVKQIKEKKGSVNHVNADGWLGGESLTGDTFHVSQTYPLAAANRGVVEFLIDSGATHHLVNDQRLLSSIESVPKITFGLAGSGSLESTQKGLLNINLKDSPSLKVADVYYVPGVRLNILSVMKLRHSGWKIDFNSHALSHGSTTFRMTSSGLPRVTFGAPRQISSPLGNTFAVPQIDSPLYNEHVRLGHIGRTILIELAKGGNLRYPLDDLMKDDFKLSDCQLCLFPFCFGFF